jgi:hypothetical protein
MYLEGKMKVLILILFLSWVFLVICSLTPLGDMTVGEVIGYIK